MQDISATENIPDINTKNPDAVETPVVSQNEKILMSDIDNGLKGDISLEKEHTISVEHRKKKNKKTYFDALEKTNKTSLRDFLLIPKKYIYIQTKKKSEQSTPYMLYFHRYLKNLRGVSLALFAFGMLVCIGILGGLDKILVENRVNAGYQKLLDIREGDMSLYEIQKKVNNARFDLLIADTFFLPFSIFPGSKIDSVDHVIAGGRYLSKSLDNILGLYSKTRDFIDEKTLSKIYFTQLFINVFPELKNIEQSLLASLYHYESISWLPNQELQEKKDGNIIKIKKILSYIQSLTGNYDNFLSFLGHEERKRYLIVFQNSDEIRPTGGFMGSMGLLEIFRGQVQLFQKKDVYAIEWDLKKSDYERLPAPKGLDQLTDTFGLRDANYYLNLKDSSNAIKFFTDRAGIELDGIVYINQNILLHLLDITGPVYFPELERDITSENFSEIMSLVVEAKTFKEGTLGTPKQALFDFMEIFSEKLMSDGAYFDYLQSMIHDVESRDIMVYSFHESENNFLKEMQLSGDINYDASLDFSYPVYTSLSGNKSDRYMKRKFRQTVTTGESCSFNVKLEIENTHDMGIRKRESIQSLISEYQLDTPNLFEIQGAAPNKQFVRLILPKNAEIIPQDNMAVIDYGSRKGVEFFTETQIQQTTFNTIEYVLQNPECKPYDYSFYKQPGIPSYDMIFQFNDKTYSYPTKKEDFYFELRDDRELESK